jgi:hypothetical protein
MKQQVKNLYDGLNLSTIPKSIKDYFYSMSHNKGKFDEMKPFFFKHTYDSDITFYVLERHLATIETFIDKEQIVDNDNSLITREEYNEYLKEYGKGFYKGYTEYEATLKPETTLFDLENEQTVHRVFSRVYNNGLRRNDRNLPLQLINPDRQEQLEKLYSSKNFVAINKEAHYEHGITGGQFYKAWEIILNNSTLFEDIFTKTTLKDQKPKEDLNPIIEAPDLLLKDIPNCNLQQRYDIFKRLGFDIKILQIDTSKQTSTHKILALIMGISPDNAKHLLNNTYKDYKLDDKEDLEEYLSKINVKL